MAPAQVEGATRRGRAPHWTPESVITEIQHFVQAHGEVPRLADLNPGQAKITGQVWRIERYRAGCPVCGSPYPSANAARRCFGGSLEQAVRAAGFGPAKRGPRRRSAVDLSERAMARLELDARVAVDAALARASAAEQRAGRLEAALARARAQAQAAPKVRTKVVRERVVDESAVARERRRVAAGEERVQALRDEVAEARMDAAEARRTAARLASRLERAEATVADARAQRREAQAALADARRDAQDGHARIAALERDLDALRSAPVAATAAPEQVALDAALQEARDAQAATRRAQRRAADAEGRYAELAAAATGSARRLTPGELAALRDEGPAGPALLADALRSLAAARRTENPQRLAEALATVAAAAVTWRDRLP